VRKPPEELEFPQLHDLAVPDQHSIAEMLATVLLVQWIDNANQIGSSSTERTPETIKCAEQVKRREKSSVQLLPLAPTAISVCAACLLKWQIVAACDNDTLAVGCNLCFINWLLYHQGFFIWLSAPNESQLDFLVWLWGVVVWGHRAKQWSQPHSGLRS
jgi:hypothetical protein